MPAKVVDASVLAAVAFQEARAAEAFEALRNASLHAPTLMAYEIANVAWKKVHLYKGQEAVIEQQLDSALQLDILWVEVDALAAFHLATETGLTVYDATYLHLARSLGLPLLTFDNKLHALSLEKP